MSRLVINQSNARKRIILASKKCFVKNGFSGTSLREIAEKAGVPVSLIYHYFDNKVHLWKEVKLAFLQSSDPQIEQNLEACESFAAFIQTFVHHRLAMLSRYPEIVRLLDWQRFEDNKTQLIGLDVPGSTEKRKSMLDYLRYYRQCGQLNTELSDDYIISLIFGLLTGPFIKTGNAFFTCIGERKHYADKAVQIILTSIEAK